MRSFNELIQEIQINGVTFIPMFELFKIATNQNNLKITDIKYQMFYHIENTLSLFIRFLDITNNINNSNYIELRYNINMDCFILLYCDENKDYYYFNTLPQLKMLRLLNKWEFISF